MEPTIIQQSVISRKPLFDSAPHACNFSMLKMVAVLSSVLHASSCMYISVWRSINKSLVFAFTESFTLCLVLCKGSN